MSSIQHVLSTVASKALKQVIIDAILKVSAVDPTLDREGGITAEEARDSFIAMLTAELFPEHGSESVAVSPAASPVKLSKEAKAAAKAAKDAAKAAKDADKAAKAEAKAVKAASPKKSPEEKAADKEADKAAKLAAKEADKAAKEAAKLAAKEADKAAKEAEKEAAKAAKEAEKEAAKAAKLAAKASPKPSPKAAAKAAKVALPASPKAAEGNLSRLDGTWRGHLKKADKEHAKELEPELLAYLNAMSNAGFNNLGAKEHVTHFLASRAAAPVVEAAPVDLEVVEFKGKDYYVNPETKRVYEGITNAEGELTITRPVGYVGMADFKDMTLEDE